MSKIQSCTKHNDGYIRWSKGEVCPLCKLQSQLATANEKLDEYKDALATKFNAEMCEALKPLRGKIIKANAENERLRGIVSLASTYYENDEYCKMAELFKKA